MPDTKIPYDPNKPFFKSKKWWAAAVGFVVPVINLVFGLGIDPIIVWTVISPLLVYVLGQSAVDAAH